MCSIDKLQQAKNHARSRGGECLSIEYLNNRTPLEWKCNNPQHPAWFAPTDNVINKNTWCLLCSEKNKTSLDEGLKEAKEYAKSKGGECLSTEYISVKGHYYLEWKCANKEHSEWKGSVDNVIGKQTWCKQCVTEEQNTNKKDKYGLEKCQEYAKSKNGECLSTDYTNQNTKVEWKCHNDKHNSWFALPKIIARDSWCKACHNEKKIKNKIT